MFIERPQKTGKEPNAREEQKTSPLLCLDANIDRAIPVLLTSFYGCAGERCLAGSILLTVDDAYDKLKEKFVQFSSKIRVGYGLDETVQMGPVISKKHLDRVLQYVEKGCQEGAKLLLDGRKVKVEGYPDGYFLGPTIFDEVRPEMAIARVEIFGPVVGIPRVGSLEEAINLIHLNLYDNAASIFTSRGKWTREFKYKVQCGNIGINIGIAAPMALFPFGGMKGSFFVVLHGQGGEAVDFFTDRKIVITRWL